MHLRDRSAVIRNVHCQSPRYWTLTRLSRATIQDALVGQTSRTTAVFKPVGGRVPLDDTYLMKAPPKFV